MHVLRLSLVCDHVDLSDVDSIEEDIEDTAQGQSTLEDTTQGQSTLEDTGTQSGVRGESALDDTQSAVPESTLDDTQSSPAEGATDDKDAEVTQETQEPEPEPEEKQKKSKFSIKSIFSRKGRVFSSVRCDVAVSCLLPVLLGNFRYSS